MTSPLSSTHFDDAVVGAGILGLAHAYHLARRGRKVIVFERSPQAMGASVRNFGMLWPIGQPPGPKLDMARRSLALWAQVLAEIGLWHVPTGSLHLAYEDDEAEVLREFAAGAEAAGYDCRLLTAAEVCEKSSAVKPNGLKAGLWSETEVCVDPREVVASLPGYLARTYGVTFKFSSAVTACDGPLLRAAGCDWRAGHLWICTGDDLQTLYPSVFAGSGLFRCKLQMMRTEPQTNGWQLGPMLAGGLTLRHYQSFAQCPSLAAVRARVSAQMPDYDRYGIHVMASQNGRGEIVIGDSHEYGGEITPFDKTEIDRLVLDYLKSFLCVPHLRLAARWNGVYAKHPQDAYFADTPESNVRIVTGVGGAGMTLSFGLAEQQVEAILGR